jgi:lipopolysaccharide export system permease protein
MRRLERHVGRTVLAAIGMVLLVLVGIDALSAFIDESDSLTENYGFAEIAHYVLLTVPRRCYEFIPFAALVGVMIGLGQLASSSELTVMRAAGVSTGRLVWFAMRAALIVAAIGVGLGEYLAPPMEQRAQSERALALDPGEGIAGRFGVWNREGNSFVHVNAIDADGDIQGMTLLQFDDGLQMTSSLRARSATFQGDHWLLRDAVRTEFSSWETRSQHSEELRWDTGITPPLLTMKVLTPEQLPVVDVYRYGRYLQRQGLDADDFELALWRKLLQPLSIAALVLIAISFVFGPLRDGTMGFRIFAGVLVGILFRMSQDLLGPASLVFGFSPLYAAAAPIGICLLLGSLLLWRAR